MNVEEAYAEFSVLKNQNTQRNYDYYLLRQAVRGKFRWPRNWPAHISKLTHNLCKPIAERHVTFLIGKGFTWNINRPNNLEFRDAAERSEKVLRRILDLSRSELQFNMGASNGTQLGRTVFKVYKAGLAGSQHACFTNVQPDYFYGVQSADGALGDYSVVYYSYPMDIAEARRLFGNRKYDTESGGRSEQRYDVLLDSTSMVTGRSMAERRVPVFECWTKKEYLLVVGGNVIYNGETPMKWSATGEGFIPFVVIENVRVNGADEVYGGEADIAQARELNEYYNYLISRKFYLSQRFQTPTIVWEGAPSNYAEILSNTINGGGAISTRLGSRLSFLTYDRPSPMVAEVEQTLRKAILESSGMSELALQGTTTGSVNTGTALNAMFTPVLSSINKKREEWTYGIRSLFAMLLELQESIGDSKALGKVALSAERTAWGQVKSKESEGDIVVLSGKDIAGLRDVSITWPDVLPRDDAAFLQEQIQLFQAGVQSLYTTLENMGVEYPDDEIARIRWENNDPALRGEKVAEQTRAVTPLLKAQMENQLKQRQMDMQAQQEQLAQAQQAPDYNQQDQTPQPADTTLRDRLIAAKRPALDTGGDMASFAPLDYQQ